MLRYVLLALRLTRVVELTEAELAALRLVLERAGVRVLPSESGDKAIVARSLARLLESGLAGEETQVLALTRGIVASPGE